MTSWRRFESIPLYWAFVASMVFGGPVRVPEVNKNEPGDLSGWDPLEHADSLQLICQEGRAQLDRQTERLAHVTGRAHIVLGIGVVVLAYGAAVLGDMDGKVGGVPGLLTTLTWIAGFLFALSAVLGAGSIIVVRADFSDVDTTQLSNRTPPIFRSLAGDYAEAVVEGENTVAARVRMLRTTTRVLVVGVALLAVSNAAAQF
jgi:hypothetical protein